MHRLSLVMTGAAVGLIAILSPAGAAAQEVVEPTPVSSTPFGAPSLDDHALGAIAGREDTQQISTAKQVAGVSESSVGDNVQTGDAKISDSAFQNFSGLSILNVNTGNNVAINAAMNVNISIQPNP